MRTAILMSALFGASVLAAPVPEELRKEFDANGEHVVELIDIVVETITVTGGQPAPTPTPPAPAPPVAANNKHEYHHNPPAPTPPASQPQYQAPPPPKQQTQPAAAPAPAASSAPAASPSPSYSSGGNDGSPMSGKETVLQTVNRWRKKYNVPTLTWNPDLASKAVTQAQYNVANKISGLAQHDAGKGDGWNGQVIGPGMISQPPETQGESTSGMTPFEFTYVMGWMCESPGDPQLQDPSCAQAQAAWAEATWEHDGTGHHDILIGSDYTSIGCGWASNGGSDPWPGSWICSLKL